MLESASSTPPAFLRHPAHYHPQHSESSPSTRVSTSSTLYSDYKTRLTEAALSEHNSQHLHIHYAASQCTQTSAPFQKQSFIPELRSLPPSPPKRPKSKLFSRSVNLDRKGDNQNKSNRYGANDLCSRTVLETDPQNTTLLWKLVRMDEQETSYLPRRPKRSHTSVTPSVQESRESLKSKRNSPYNADFNRNVLAPRWIKIDSSGIPMHAFAHFEVDEPRSDQSRRTHYTDDRMAAHSSVWVEVDDNFVESVAKNYQRMDRRKMCEAEFASYAKEKLLKQDDFLLDKLGERAWKTERMLELVAKPEPDTLWKAPPVLEDLCSATDLSRSDYSFDLRPDCAYWLSLRAFNPDYLGEVENWAMVIQEEVTCPYVTVEFKKDNLAEARATSQVAAAASVALYNRYQVRKKRLELQGKQWTPRLTKIIRHYGLTLSGPRFTVWCVEPALSHYDWAGCEMRVVCRGNCTRNADVRKLIHWINEIHFWGLTKHGPRLAKDVKYSIETQQKKTGHRVSAIQRDSEDDPDSGNEEETRSEA